MASNAFCNSTQFLQYTDTNRVCELLSDDVDGVPIPVAQLATNATLQEIFDAATQEIVSACQIGNRYTVGELICLYNDNQGGEVTLIAGLYTITVNTGVTITGVGAKLRRLCAQLAWGELVGRKKFTGEEFAKMAPGYKQALADLEQLRLGERIFPSVTGTPEAGLPGVEVLGINNCGSINQSVGLWGNVALGNIWRNGVAGGCCSPEGWR